MERRTKEIYLAHCAELDGPLHDHIATTYGVAGNSILNDLDFFHVTTGLVPDIMHNILEGMHNFTGTYYHRSTNYTLSL